MQPPIDPTRLDLLKHWVRDPKELVSGVNRRFNRMGSDSPCNPAGDHIFDENWDVLVLLDSCRYDALEARVSFDGRLEHRISRGSATKEFIRGNFTGQTHHDVVYVSALTWYLKLRDEIGAELHEFVNLVDSHTTTIEDPDGETQEVVLPETVTRVATAVAEEYPNKRLIVHYGQPHQPYLGEWARERFKIRGGLRRVVASSDVSRSDIWQGYRETLDRALEAVGDLLEAVDGKTVVTADHGELLGERQRPIPISYYGHLPGVYVDELVKVPWYVIEDGHRREPIAEEPVNRSATDQSRIDEHLRSLGYRV